MVRTAKRVISVILVIAMTLLFMPVIASAATAKSGTCGADGDNLTWEINDEGTTLTISGEGEMEDWLSGTAPWYSYPN